MKDNTNEILKEQNEKWNDDSLLDHILTKIYQQEKKDSFLEEDKNMLKIQRLN